MNCPFCDRRMEESGCRISPASEPDVMIHETPIIPGEYLIRCAASPEELLEAFKRKGWRFVHGVDTAGKPDEQPTPEI